MQVKIKKLNNKAVIPQYAKPGDAGLDLVAISLTTTSIDMNTLYIEYGTGLSIEIPENHVGLIYPRSSLSNYHLVLANHVGVIDSGYRGEIKFRFKVTQQYPRIYRIGDKIGQIIIVPYPQIEFEEVEELTETERGTGGYGSSGA